MIDPNTGLPLAGADGNKGWEEVDAIIRSKIVQISSSEFQFTDCPHICKTRQNLGVHIEAIHVEHPDVICGLCGNLCTTRDALRKHVYRPHKSGLQKLNI